MVQFSERIKQALSIKKKTQAELCKITKIPKSAMSQYISGKFLPKQTRTYLIAKALNVNEAWLMGYDVPMERKEEKKESFLDDREERLITDYKILNDEGKDKADERVHELTEIPRYINTSTANKVNPYDINLFDLPVSAGTGMYLSDDTKETIQIKRTPEALKSDFALTVRGNSMEPKFFDNDIILIKSMPCIEVGAIGIFVINGDAFLKKFGGDRLISLNESYKDIIFTSEDTICCLGLVVGKAERI